MKQGAYRGARGTASRLKAAGGTVLKVAAWVVAVPALCLVVGAAPLYMLLPDDKSEAAAPAKPVLVGSSSTATVETRHREADSEQKNESADLASVGSVSPPAADAPAEDMATAAPPEAAREPPHPTKAAAVIPTPRPEPPVPATVAEATSPVMPPVPKPVEKPPVKLAAIEPPAEPRNKPETKVSAGGSDRAVVSRKVTLRAGPWGRQLGTLDPGTSVAVGRCAEWCEVRTADGARGWVHPSFLAGALPAKRGNDARSPDRREVARRDRDDAEARAWARARERQRYREEADLSDPDWFIDDEPPVLVGRRRAPHRLDELEGYLPY